jgi:signal transduction histidine kinase/ActR/RegA family two-component response regulator
MVIGGRRIVSNSVLASFALLTLAAGSARAADGQTEVWPRPQRVLALFDFEKHAPANVIWDATLRETLQAGGASSVEYYAEYFDSSRFRGPEHTALMHDYLRRKYEGLSIDVIIAMDLTSRFLVGPGRDLFTDVPIVHTVGLGFHPAAASDDPRLVGIRGVFDARATLETALALHPGTTEVMIVCATAKRDGFFADELHRQLVGLQTTARLTYLLDRPLSETLARTQNLGPHALVLFVVSYDPNDPAYAGRYPSDVAAEIAQVSGAPVYGLYSSYLRGGVVGGHVYSLEAAASMAGRTALRILVGEKPKDIGALYAPIVPMFDWRQLRRWGIDEERLPPGSQVLYRQVSAWETYRLYMIGGAILVAIELVLIGGLLLERRGRRQALRALEESHGELVQRIAEREHAEGQLQDNNRRLAQALDVDRRKDEFLATLGHELRNPLAPISLAVAIMRERPDDQEHLVWAREMIGRQVTLLSRLVDDLLDVSRITLGKVEMRQDRLALAKIARQAVDASRPLFAERRHQLQLDVQAEDVVVRGDAVRLTQVISNLLNNAAKYTNPGGHVQVRVQRDGADATVSVSDNGVGIPPEMVEHVFDPFTQVASARQHAHGGLGIGLTLVKRIVEMHGGSVRARSDGEGRGSEFEVRLPTLADESANRLKASGIYTLIPQTAMPRRILVVDDNVDAAESLRRALAGRRHDVDVVHDGIAAMEAAQRLEPDVVLLDIDLPRMDGLEVARRLRSLWSIGAGRRALLVATTGLGRELDRHRTKQAGFDHHLVKPIDLTSLESLLTSAD